MDRHASPRATRAWLPRIVTLLFALLLLAWLIIANTVGHLEVTAEPWQFLGSSDRPLDAVRSTQAGWPWTYVTIREYRNWPLANLETGVTQLSTVALLLDIAVGLLAIGLGAWLFHQGWTRRRRLFQFGLLDLTVVTGLVGVVLGYGFMPRMQHARDAAVLAALDPHKEDSEPDPFANPFRQPRRDKTVRQAIWHTGRNQWLRDLVGEDRLPPTGHIVGLSLRGVLAPEAARLPRLQAIQIFDQVSDRDLNVLAQLPQLDYLDLSEARLRPDKGGYFDSSDYHHEYPLRIPRLKRLDAPGTVLQGSDLAGCTGLEELDLSRTVVDPTSAQTIGKLTSLRVLMLRGSSLDDDGLAQLAGLQALTTLDISDTRVTDGGIRHLHSLSNLHTLWIADTAITDAGFVALEGCPNLTTIRSTGTKVTARGALQLQRARRARLAAR
jgi:hypothetical protein